MTLRYFPQLCPRKNPHSVHSFGRFRSHTPELSDGQSVYEAERLGLGNREKPIGFAIIRCNFSQKLVIRNTRRSCQLGPLSDFSLDFYGQLFSPFDSTFIIGDIEKGLVDR